MHQLERPLVSLGNQEKRRGHKAKRWQGHPRPSLRKRPLPDFSPAFPSLSQRHLVAADQQASYLTLWFESMVTSSFLIVIYFCLYCTMKKFAILLNGVLCITTALVYDHFYELG